MKRVRRVWRCNFGGWKSRWPSVKMRLQKVIIIFLCGKRALSEMVVISAHNCRKRSFFLSS